MAKIADVKIPIREAVKDMGLEVDVQMTGTRVFFLWWAIAWVFISLARLFCPVGIRVMSAEERAKEKTAATNAPQLAEAFLAKILEFDLVRIRNYVGALENHLSHPGALSPTDEKKQTADLLEQIRKASHRLQDALYPPEVPGQAHKCTSGCVTVTDDPFIPGPNQRERVLEWWRRTRPGNTIPSTAQKLHATDPTVYLKKQPPPLDGEKMKPSVLWALKHLEQNAVTEVPYAHADTVMLAVIRGKCYIPDSKQGPQQLTLGSILYMEPNDLPTSVPFEAMPFVYASDCDDTEKPTDGFPGFVGPSAGEVLGM